MSGWSLPKLLAGLHGDMQRRLEVARSSLAHSTTMGDASENVWIDLLNDYLPVRYKAAKAHVVDSKGAFSQQIDVVIFDRQYTPLIFNFQGQIVVPAESVYAVFEAKQALNLKRVQEAQTKAASVRALERTSVQFHSGGAVETAKPLLPIMAGILTLDSDWKPFNGDALAKALAATDANGRLDFGCIAAEGHFHMTEAGYQYIAGGKPAAAFLFELIARLQSHGTVPAIDVRAYARWLDVAVEPIS